MYLCRVLLANIWVVSQFLGILNKTTMNIYVQVIWWTYAIICLEYTKEQNYWVIG